MGFAYGTECEQCPEQLPFAKSPPQTCRIYHSAEKEQAQKEPFLVWLPVVFLRPGYWCISTLRIKNASLFPD